MAHLAKTALILVGVTTIGFVAFEVGSYAVVRLKDRLGVDPRWTSSQYQGQSWARAHWIEMNARRTAYHSYVGWRQAPQVGTTIVVDRDGLRRTVHTRCDGSAYLIYMFGGSTLWGTGVPDWLTIPSLLADLFSKSGRSVCVRNYGESGWVSTQEVIMLMLELKNRRKPDLAVFYDGVNDVINAYQFGPREVHHGFDEMKEQFEVATARGRGHFRYVFETNTATMLERLGRSIGLRAPYMTRYGGGQVSAEQVASFVVNSYVRNTDIIEALARRYAFEYVMFWQPFLLADGKPLTDEERAIHRSGVRMFPGLDVLAREVYRLVRTADDSRVVYIGDVFASERRGAYIDVAHLGPEGNGLVAARIYEALRRRGTASETR